MRTVTLYIATSLDGFIAGPGGSLDFLESAQSAGEDYGYAAFTDSIDTVVVGRKTYASVLDMGVPYPHSGKRVYVYSKQLAATADHTEVHPGSPVDHVRDLKCLPGKGIYCEGGADIAQQLLRAELIDRIVLSTIPVHLHAGVELFPAGQLPPEWLPQDRRVYPSGLIQTTYLPA